MASLIVIDGSTLTVGEDEPACSKLLCDLADLALEDGMMKNVYGKMLLEEKRGVLSLTKPSGVKSAVVSCDVKKSYVPSGALDVEVVMCENPDSFKKFEP